MKAIVGFSRYFVGLLFIFSGFIKANDPIGFSYKLEEYFVLFGMDWLASIALVLAMFICVFEIVLGIALVLGLKSNTVTWLLLLMILFFTWLTGYSAITGKVTDCGCFGDAIPLTPWQSFYKDIILTVLIGILFWQRKNIKPYLKEKNSLQVVGVFTLICSVFTMWCYMHLPVLDFRPYKVGADIQKLMSDGIPDEIEMVFIYKNKASGEEKEFSATDIPTDGNWDYVDRKDKIIKEGKLSSIHDFVITNGDGEEFTEDILANQDYSFIVIAYDIPKTSNPAFKQITELASAAEKNGHKVVAITASDYMQVENLRHEVGAAFPFYYADATALKTIVRSNPGLLVLKDGVIKGKWHYNDMPTYQEWRDNIK